MDRWIKNGMSGVLKQQGNNDMVKIAFQQVFDNFNVNLRKNEGFLTSIPCIPEYGQSNALLIMLLRARGAPL